MVPDRLDKLRGSGNPGETGVSAVDPARQIGSPPIRGERIHTIEKNRRGARERDRGRLNTIGQQPIRHLDITPAQLGQRRFNPCSGLDPVRALINSI